MAEMVGQRPCGSRGLLLLLGACLWGLPSLAPPRSAAVPRVAAASTLPRRCGGTAAVPAAPPVGAGLVRGGVVEGEVGTGAVAAAVAAVLLLVGDPHLHVVGGDGHVAAPEGLEAALPGEGAHLVVVVDHVPPLHLPALQLAHRLQAGPVEPHHQEGQAQQHEAEGRHGGAQAHAEVPPARGDQVEAGHRQAQPEREAGARPPQRGAEVHPLAGRAAGQGRLHLARPEVREEAPLLEEGLRGVHDPPREPRVLCGF
eukprot:CAMPEP_0179293420 /NCGR_PEP_ID=MMETSP0797-20121207/43364_1 /TAXON_ID=47934 /ORGANISM="Dinophysis acuminata, Strain DAEP01" /LENGTH=255 /DNA_ID=CAMNT_0021002567 /DNA_START=25 /DNA_END=790 /DNA_ORIENTATION=+